MAPRIQYLQHSQIDKTKWDRCIDNASNGLIYAYSFYLDEMADNWDGLILNDFEAVMPLPWRKKFGIKYLYMPAFTQQLGLIGNIEVDYRILITQVEKKFKYGDIAFNYKNPLQGVAATKKTNFVLPLPDLQEIRKHYSKDLKKNLKKADRHNFEICSKFNPSLVIDLFKKHYADRIQSISRYDYDNFLVLSRKLNLSNMAFTRVIKSHAGETQAAALFLIDKNRIYNVMNVTTIEGRSRSSNHHLLDAIINEFSGKELLFDFEGSDIPGVQEFYLNFKPLNQPFYYYHFNRLPFPFNFIKK